MRRTITAPSGAITKFITDKNNNSFNSQLYSSTIYIHVNRFAAYCTKRPYSLKKVLIPFNTILTQYGQITSQSLNKQSNITKQVLHNITVTRNKEQQPASELPLHTHVFKQEANCNKFCRYTPSHGKPLSLRPLSKPSASASMLVSASSCKFSASMLIC